MGVGEEAETQMDVLKSLYQHRTLLKAQQLLLQQVDEQAEQLGEEDPATALSRHYAGLLAKELGNYYRAGKLLRSSIQPILAAFNLQREDGVERYNFWGGVLFFHRAKQGKDDSRSAALLIKSQPISNPLQPDHLLLTEQSSAASQPLQGMVIWESQVHGDIPDLWAVHLLSAPFNRAGFESLAKFLKRTVHLHQGAPPLPSEIPALLRNWKQLISPAVKPHRTTLEAQQASAPEGNAPDSSGTSAGPESHPHGIPGRSTETPHSTAGNSEVPPPRPAGPPSGEHGKSAQNGLDAAHQLAELVTRKLGNQRLSAVQDLITSKDHKKIVRKIFNGDENRYRNFADRLNRITHWAEAARLMEAEFREQGINPYSKVALLLSDYAYKRFFPKENSTGNEQKF